METNQIKVNIENGVKEVIFRQGKAPEVHIPNGMNLTDLTISAVHEYLKKDGINPEEIKNSYVLFSYEDRYIELNFALRRENSDIICGIIQLHPDLEKFEINKGKRYSPYQLADFIRMNRHYFETKDIAMKLESSLRKFTTEVDKKLEASDDKRANIKSSIVQNVKTSIPESFNIKIPVFIGTGPITVNIEVDINSDDLSCSLMSPDLKSLIETESIAIINIELQQIRELYPELRIFQK